MSVLALLYFQICKLPCKQCVRSSRVQVAGIGWRKKKSFWEESITAFSVFFFFFCIFYYFFWELFCNCWRVAHKIATSTNPWDQVGGLSHPPIRHKSGWIMSLLPTTVSSQGVTDKKNSDILRKNFDSRFFSVKISTRKQRIRFELTWSWPIIFREPKQMKRRHTTDYKQPLFPTLDS